MASAFAKKEPIAAPGPALVIGAMDESEPKEEPSETGGPTISLTGDMAAPIARDFSPGDEFDGDGKFRVVSVDGGNVELELVDITPSAPGEETAEGAVDDYLAQKGGGGGAEEELM